MKTKNTKKVAAKKPVTKAVAPKKTETKKVAPAKKPVAKPVKKAAAKKPALAAKKTVKKVTVKTTVKSEHRKQRGRTAPNRALSVKKEVTVKKTVVAQPKPTLPNLDFKPSFLSDLTKKATEPIPAAPVKVPVLPRDVQPGVATTLPPAQLTPISALSPVQMVRADPFAGCVPVQPL